MVKRTEADWRALFEAHDASGLSAATFCKENKLCPKYFSLRRRQLLGEKPKVVSPAFVKIERSKSVASRGVGDIRLKAGAVELQLIDASPEFIAAVVKQLA